MHYGQIKTITLYSDPNRNPNRNPSRNRNPNPNPNPNPNRNPNPNPNPNRNLGLCSRSRLMLNISDLSTSTFSN